MIPVGKEGAQSIKMICKNDKGKLTHKDLIGVRYIPLTDKDK